jgi:hypothetical protein
MLDSLEQRLTDTYDDLTDREQKLVVAAGVVLPLVVLIFIGLVFNNSLNATRTEIDEKKELLNKLAEIAPDYNQNKKEGGDQQQAKFSPEAIENNNVKLTSFVATHATAVGVQVDSYDESERPISSSGGEAEGEAESSLYRADVTVEIRGATTDKLLKLLERIETADKPVVLERVTLTNQRRNAGEVRATIIVATFKRKANG